MPTLLLRFPGGRYHATPSGHHVNEGLIEWPPAPWRILRALLATGYSALGWAGDMAQPLASQPPAEARALILKLAGTLPTYRLPPSTGTHTRHYMPLGVIDKGREKTTLVFDTWAKIGEGILTVTWGVELSEGESAMLGRLAERLGYLGRSESWVEAHVDSAGIATPDATDCFPECGHVNPGPGWEQIALLAPLPAGGSDGYAAWREAAASAALAAFPLAAKEKPSKQFLKQRAKAEAPYPIDLIACLQTDTTELRRHGWSQPPGSRRVFYWRKTDALEIGAPKSRRPNRKAPEVEAILIAISTASGNDHALPSITRTLPQAELLHRQLGGTLKALRLGHSMVLSGCDENRQPLKLPHRHAHILPLDLDGDGHLEHILIWAPMGLDSTAQAAVRKLRQTFTKGGDSALRLAIESSGDLNALTQLPGSYGQRLRELLARPEGAATWITQTPFVAPRFLKPHGKNGLEGQITAELEVRGHPAILRWKRLNPWADRTATVEVCPDVVVTENKRPEQRDAQWIRFRHFVRDRRDGPPAPVPFGFALEIHFGQPVKGPLCLGYGSHFGLGLFKSIAPE